MKSVLLGALAILLVAIVWFAWRGPEDRPAATGVSRAQSPVPEHLAPASGEARAMRGNDPATAGQRAQPAQREEVGLTEAGAASTTTLRGRCVDAITRAPLAGCNISFHGERAEEEPGERGSDEPIAWQDPPPKITGTDGRFSFTFDPPPTHRFTLELRAPGIVPITGHWQPLRRGTTVDLGDVPVQRGGHVSGTIADSAGLPQAGVLVYIGQAVPEGGVTALRLHRNHLATSATDGSFAFADPVASGTWDVSLRGRQKIAPASFEVPEGQRTTTLQIETRPVSEVETISGIVVDENGAPVGGVQFRREPLPSGSSFVVRSESDGSFVVERQEHELADRIQLRFERAGFEPLVTRERHPWGTKDLRIVLRTALSVDVFVVDGDTGKPIEEYSARCFPAPQPGKGVRSSDFDLRGGGRGPHPGGRMRIEGIPRGEHVLIVEPGSDTWQTSDFVHFEVAGSGVPEQRVELFRGVTRTLRVERSGGEPVPGTTVQLLQPIGGAPVTLTTHPADFASAFHYVRPDRAVLATAGRTDNDGEFVLRGRAGRDFTLRLLGPGHPPMVAPPVRLAANAPPLVVVVPAGATITGSIRPPDILQQYGSRAARGEDDTSEEDRKRMRDGAAPGLLLQRASDGKRSTFPLGGHDQRVRFREDGSFEITAIPPGTWRLLFAFYFDPGHGRSSPETEFLETLTDLRDGEVRRIDIDASSLLPARLTGVVMMNGAPLADRLAQLIGTRPAATDGGDGGAARLEFDTRLGDGGTFALALRPATYRLRVSLPPATDGGRWRSIPAAERFVLAPGQQVHQVFQIETGGLRIRVRDESGRPMPGVQIQVTNLDRSFRTTTPPTDAEGRTAVGMAPVGTVIVSAVPKRLTDPATRRDFDRANGYRSEAWIQVLVPLGRADVVGQGGPSAAVEVVVPAKAGY